MTVNELRVILQQLSSATSKGLSALAIANKTGLPAETAREALLSHPDYFVSLPNTSSYVINSFKPHKGDTAKIIADFEQAKIKKNRERKLTHIAMFIAVMGSWLTAIISVIKNCQ